MSGHTSPPPDRGRRRRVPRENQMMALLLLRIAHLFETSIAAMNWVEDDPAGPADVIAARLRALAEQVDRGDITIERSTDR